MRITRNADIDVSKVYDEDLNYRDQMEQVVKLRKKLAPVRIEFTRDISQKMVGEVCDYCELDEKHVFYSNLRWICHLYSRYRISSGTDRSCSLRRECHSSHRILM